MKKQVLKAFYYVTAVENFDKIFLKGIKLDAEGEILLFDKQELAHRIATKQLSILDYALFLIHNVEESRLKKNEADEFTALSQWIYDKEIPVQDAKLIGCFKNR